MKKKYDLKFLKDRKSKRQDSPHGAEDKSPLPTPIMGTDAHDLVDKICNHIMSINDADSLETLGYRLPVPNVSNRTTREACCCELELCSQGKGSIGGRIFFKKTGRGDSSDCATTLQTETPMSVLMSSSLTVNSTSVTLKEDSAMQVTRIEKNREDDDHVPLFQTGLGRSIAISKSSLKRASAVLEPRNIAKELEGWSSFRW
ncbi:Breast cancer type 2 susceptibility protein-like protein [Hordeum vulgare]|nr:Breast cancer type 2 susceptibility protein-like protein [Hordeum vulgare]